MLLRKFHDIESKAFSKSINKNKPGISFSSAYSIISNKSLIFSPMREAVGKGICCPLIYSYYVLK
jgi:hypothetical protein